MVGGRDADTTCPHCDEPVGTRATYCMHCGRDIVPAGDEDPTGSDDYDTGIRTGDAAGSPGESGTGSEATDQGDRSGGGTTPEAGTTWERGTASERETTDDRGWFHPDGLLDDSLTVVVAIAAGLLIGFFSMFAFVFPLGGWGALAALVVWLGSTVYLGRRRTVWGAVRYGAYGLAVVVLILPVGLLLGADGSVLDRLGALVVFEFVVAVFAAGLAIVGYLVGRAAPGGTDPGL